MARVYEVKYEGKSYWFTGDQCGDKDVAASKVPGCRPGYNCKVSARFTGDVPAEEYIAQQKATETTAPTTTPTGTRPEGFTTKPTIETTPTASTTPSTSPSIPPGTTGPAQGYNWDEWREYELYLHLLNTEEAFAFFPIPKNISDYFDNRESWDRQAQLGTLPSTPRTADESFWIEGQRNIARQILVQDSPWLTDKGEPVDFDDKGEPIVPSDGDKEPPPGFETYDEYLTYLKRQREYSEWSMQRAEYGAQEQYRETPQYGQVFNPWLEEQGQFSGALAAFTEKEYPSLVSKYKATQPRLTGYPTREEARMEAGRREAGFGGWLGGETPAVEQKYWGQTPLMRGERPYMYQPTMRTVNW